MEGLNEEQRQQIAAAREQALATAEEAFNKLDIDGNGEVDRSEVMTLAKQGQGLPAGTSEAKINEFFATFDADGDGKIQKSEWLNFFGQLFDSVIAQSTQ